jgi:hypothetical protein
VFYHCATAALYARRKDIHSLPLLVFSGRFCSYLKPNFPAVSGSYLPDFPAVSAVTGSQIFRPYLQLLAAEFSGLTFTGTKRPGFSGRICCYWLGIFVRSFSGMGNLKNSMGSRQIVLVSTAGFPVLNTGIFWQEAKTKRLFSQCGPNNYKDTKH